MNITSTCFPFMNTGATVEESTVKHIGYEPADLTVHPPPQNCRGWVHFFRIGV